MVTAVVMGGIVTMVVCAFHTGVIMRFLRAVWICADAADVQKCFGMALIDHFHYLFPGSGTENKNPLHLHIPIQILHLHTLQYIMGIQMECHNVILRCAAL